MLAIIRGFEFRKFYMMLSMRKLSYL